MIDSPQSWRQANIGRSLNNAVRRFESRVLALLAEAGHPDARLAHLNVTRNLDDAGTRIVEVARRAALTKQSMSELIAQCNVKGLVAYGVDPHDARAKLVLFTKKGREWLAAFGEAVALAEQEMRDELGREAFDTLMTLVTLYGAGANAAEDPSTSTTPKT